MSKEICISSTPHETRLAILEDDQLAEIYYERENEYTLAGSIYKGRVTRVLPGMQSAFVEVGLERDAFLYVTDFLEEQGDSADFEKVGNGGGGRRDAASHEQLAQPAQPSAERGPAETGAGEEPRAEGDRPPRESGRSRGRGRNRGRGDAQRRESPRPEIQSPAPQALPPKTFESPSFTQAATSPEHDDAPLPAGMSHEGADAGSTPEEESQEGTRRWRGRRGRRGGARSREPREADANTRQLSPSRQEEFPANDLSGSSAEREPLPERVPAINAVHQTSASSTIVLPGESLQKYGRAQGGESVAPEAPASSSRPGSAPAATSAAKPSTLVDIPLSWDGSGQLPGETISRYRGAQGMSGQAPPPGSTEPEPHAAADPGNEQSPEPEPHIAAGHGNGQSSEPEPHIAAGQSHEQPEPLHETQASPHHSAFERAFEAQQAPAQIEAAQHVADEQVSHGQTADETAAEMTEEVTEFDPSEGSASHRVDPSARSEFRVPSVAEEEAEAQTHHDSHDEAEDEAHSETGEQLEATAAPELEAPVGFHSVAPPTASPEEIAQDQSSQSAAYPAPGAIHETPAAAAPQPIHEEGSTPIAVAPAPSETVTQERGAEEQRAKPESFWKVVKELVTGHSSPKEEAAREETAREEARRQEIARREIQPGQSRREQLSADDPSAAAASGDRGKIEEEKGEEARGLNAASPTLNHPERPGEGKSEQLEEGENNSQNFAPGPGVLEEETIDEEDYDYEPVPLSSEDHDLEDLEEETLEHHGGIELAEMVRETHLEQRVQTDAGSRQGDGEEESYGEDAAGGFVEEDFEEQAGEAADDEEEGEPGPDQIAAPGRTDTGRTAERTSDNRDRGRGRGRGRRPGPGGSHSGGGGRRQNTQASDLPPISELLKQGQEILVQIAKEPMAKKGARITSHIALPGRFLVFMPTVNHVGVSRKIASDDERQRLKRILISEKGTAAGGFIVRTAADGAGEEDLRADIRFLLSLWGEIKQRSDEAKAPALIYHDLNLIERVLRDQVSDNFTAIWVDSETEYERIVRFLQRFQPSLVRRVKLYTKETPLFEQFGIQEEISKALKSKVWLKSGGSIVINQTEALVAIDINTGKFVGKTARLEDTILRTNLDAIPEIVRQIRLRDLGGIIVIDFIDMDERKNRNRVMQALEDELKHDRAPSKVLQFNDFGLVAITRKRVKQSLERTLSVQCEVCTGTGMVKSPTTVCNEIYTEMRRMYRSLEHKDVMLRVHPEVVKSLKSTNGRWLNELEEMTGKTIIVKSDPALHPEQFDIH